MKLVRKAFSATRTVPEWLTATELGLPLGR